MHPLENVYPTIHHLLYTIACDTLLHQQYTLCTVGEEIKASVVMNDSIIRKPV